MFSEMLQRLTNELCTVNEVRDIVMFLSFEALKFWKIKHYWFPIESSNMHHHCYCNSNHLYLPIFSSFSLQKIKEPFLEAVKITLGDRYTDYMANVYTKTIDFILSALSHGYLDKNQCYELQSTKSPVTSSDQQSTKSPGKNEQPDQVNGVPSSDQSGVPKIENSTKPE